MRAFKVIKDPEAFQLLADETRRRVIYLLRAKPMTVSQIAAELSLTPQAIYHHIRRLKDAGLVEVAREERVDHFIETYFQATAEVFHLSHGEGMSESYAREKIADTLRALEKVGFHLDVDADAVSQLADLEKRMEEVGEKSESMDKIGELEDVDFFVKQGVAHYAKLLTMTDNELNEYLRLVREHRKLVRSLMKVPAKA